MIRRSSFSPFLTALVVSVLAFSAPGPVFAQGQEYVKTNYTKYEHRIPMRDGIHLFTSVYVPKDQSQVLSDHALAHAIQRPALWR